MSLWGIRPDFSGLSPCYRQIAYVLLTRAPVAAKSIATSALPLDLHVLGLSLAFILSQDQTLRCISNVSFLYLQSDSRPKLTSFFLLYYTCFFSVLSMNCALRFPFGRAVVLSKSDAKVHSFYHSLQIFWQLFYAIKHTFPSTSLFPHTYKQTFFLKKIRPCHFKRRQGRKWLFYGIDLLISFHKVTRKLRLRPGRRFCHRLRSSPYRALRLRRRLSPTLYRPA